MNGNRIIDDCGPSSAGRQRNNDELIDLDRRHVWHPFTRLGAEPDPLLITSGRGAVLKTADGRELLDGISSWWVNLFGHGRPEIADAIAAQSRRLEHVVFAGCTHPPAIRLAQRLAAWLPGDLNRVFFSDNGSTSVEVALKIAWQYWQNIGQPGRNRVMAFDGGYHGDTVGAMSAGVGSGFFDKWKKQLIPCDLMPWPNTWIDDLDVAQKETEAVRSIDEFLGRHATEVAALIMEPLVQGAAGMRMVRPEFIQSVTQRLQEQGIPVIFDEVMTGFGRTGTMFALEQAAVTPDLICLSKGLTGGFLPMGVTVVSDRIARSFSGDDAETMFCHGHSYTANPLGCAAALATLELLEQPETAEHWRRIQLAQQRGWRSVIERGNVIRARVSGTIAAIDVVSNDPGYHSQTGRRLARWLREENSNSGSVLLRPLGNVLYLMPPYCMTDDQLMQCWEAIDKAVQAVTGS